MCLGCATLDSAPTQYHKTVVFLTLAGLKATEIAHVDATMLSTPAEMRLIIPPVIGCRCQSCTREKKDGPWKYDITRARVLKLGLVLPEGLEVYRYIWHRKTQMAQTTGPISAVAKSLGLSWDGLQRWGPHFLHHRYGLSPETIAVWHNKTKVYLEAPFPGHTLALDSLSKAYTGLGVLYPPV